jgi:hydroxypyruvate reductase
MRRDRLREIAESIWRAGVAAVDGRRCVAAALAENAPPLPDWILAVGKAAPAMAEAALAHYGISIPCLIVTKYSHWGGAPAGANVRVIEAGHPVPDGNSLAGGRALFEAIVGMAADSRLLLLVSGGASALAEHLIDGMTLEMLRAENARMLAAGWDIHAINARRKQISRIKGGGLLSNFSGRHAAVLAISDVEGDDIGVIGSGIGAAPAGMSDGRYSGRIVASNAIARQAAAQMARDLGLQVQINEEALYDDVLACAASIGPRLRAMAPGCAIFGGEPTVTLPEQPGEGGRNQALALALAREIRGMADFCVLAAGTDGSDGPTDAAGAFADGQTWGDGAAEALANADSGRFLREHGDRFAPGPTGTNVMDLVVAVRA